MRTAFILIWALFVALQSSAQYKSSVAPADDIVFIVAADKADTINIYLRGAEEIQLNERIGKRSPYQRAEVVLTANTKTKQVVEVKYILPNRKEFILREMDRIVIYNKRKFKILTQVRM